MATAQVEPQLSSRDPLELVGTHLTVIFRNASLEARYPGGREAFMARHSADANEDITVHCVSATVIADTVKECEAMGLNRGQDFVVIDTVECEMWRMIHEDTIERPFWFETGADWLRYKHWKGRVLVWYNR